MPVFGVGEQDGLHYYVMQFIPGQGLDAVLEELRRLRRGDGPAAGGRHSGDRSGDGSVAASAADVARSLLTGQFSRRASPADGALGRRPSTDPAAAIDGLEQS